MKQTLTAMVLIALLSTLVLANERSDVKRVIGNNPVTVSGPALKGTLASLNESFEDPTFPPAGWVKHSPDGGSGWTRLTEGTTPLPGWQGGYASMAPGGGMAAAYCTWTTGGASSNDQWLVTHQITGIQAGDSLTFWMRKFSNLYADNVDVKVSTSDDQIASFSTDLATINFLAADTGWVRYAYSLAAYAGQDIHIAFREHVTDNINDGAAIFLDLVKAGAQAVNVTFRVNAATVPDTMSASSVFQVRGDTAPLTWGGDTGGDLTNVGGDYWEVTLPFNPGTSINYKFFANAEGNASGNGWESNLGGGSNDRQITVGTADTTLPLQYFNTTTGNDQYFVPYAETDSFDVYFRVNVHRLVQFNNFDPATQVMMVKGGTWPGSWGDLTWNTATPSKILAPETGSDNAGQFTYPAENFWSGSRVFHL